jgi:hypothetical protein
VVEAVLGPIVEVDAKTEILWPTIKLTDTGVESARETADHAGILGKTQSGAVFRADISGGVSATDARFSFEISGSAGWLSLTLPPLASCGSDEAVRRLLISYWTPTTPAFDHACIRAFTFARIK